MGILKEATTVINISEEEGMGGIEDICNHCLGRQFANLSTGLSNDQRGKSIRVSLAMENDREFKKPESCWICGNIFKNLDFWKKKAIESTEEYEFESFLIGNKTPPLIEENEVLIKERRPEEKTDLSEDFSREFNRELGKKIETEINAEVKFENPQIVIIVDIQRGDIELQISSVYVYGRYRKLKRGIPQTKWPCRECEGKGCERCDNTGKLYEESVEELISPPVLSDSKGEEVKFHGSGREDVDALMLGNGRPFILEVKNPKNRSLDLESLEKRINKRASDKVEVESLREVDRDSVEKVKNLRSPKTYRSEVSFSEKVKDKKVKEALNKLEGKIEQRTPKRVDHRRSDKIRERKVYNIKGERKNGNWTIEIKGEAGLYVKELISGDNGRTQPNLSSLLGTDAEIEKLDVIKFEGGLEKE